MLSFMVQYLLERRDKADKKKDQGAGTAGTAPAADDAGKQWMELNESTRLYKAVKAAIEKDPGEKIVKVKASVTFPMPPERQEWTPKIHQPLGPSRMKVIVQYDAQKCCQLKLREKKGVFEVRGSCLARTSAEPTNPDCGRLLPPPACVTPALFQPGQQPLPHCPLPSERLADRYRHDGACCCRSWIATSTSNGPSKSRMQSWRRRWRSRKPQRQPRRLRRPRRRC